MVMVWFGGAITRRVHHVFEPSPPRRRVVVRYGQFMILDVNYSTLLEAYLYHSKNSYNIITTAAAAAAGWGLTT